jgi:cobalt/nickel transport system permease protein
MAFVLPFAGYFIYKFIKERTKSAAGEYAGAAAGAWFGINVAALAAAVEFGLQPLLFHDAAGVPLYCPYPLSVSIPAMLIPHMLAAGVAEAAFTAAVFAFVKKASPGMIRESAGKRIGPAWALVALLVCLSPLGLLAAGTAWGEWGADEIGGVVSGGSALGYTPAGMENGFRFSAPLPDYTVGNMPEIAGYVLSAVAGAAILVIVFKLLSLVKKNKRPA